MKTQIYYPHAEIKAITLVMVLSVAFLFSLKAQELPTQSTLESFTAGIYTPNNELIGLNNDSVTEAGNAQLAQGLKSMMSSGSYWSNDEADRNENLVQMLAGWMKNGLYWEENKKITDDDFSNEPIAANDEE